MNEYRPRIAMTMAAALAACLILPLHSARAGSHSPAQIPTIYARQSPPTGDLLAVTRCNSTAVHVAETDDCQGEYILVSLAFVVFLEAEVTLGVAFGVLQECEAQRITLGLDTEVCDWAWEQARDAGLLWMEAFFAYELTLVGYYDCIERNRWPEDMERG